MKPSADPLCQSLLNLEAFDRDGGANTEQAHEQGSLIAELAIVTPFILFLVLGSLEFSRVLDMYQWTSQLSREVASIAYRTCSAKRAPFLQACLRTRVLDRIDLNSDALTPGIEYIIGTYNYGEVADAGAPGGTRANVEQLRIEGSTNSEFNQYFEEHFSVNALNDQIDSTTVGSAGLALKENGVLVIVTAFIPFQEVASGSVIPFFRFATPDTIQSSTII